MERNAITVDAGDVKKSFNHFYRAVGYANVDFTYTAPFRKMYDHLSSFHNAPKYMRLHNILTAHGRGDYYLLQEGSDYGNPADQTARFDKVVSLTDDGQLSFDWEVVDRVYDIFVEHNIKPIVETQHVPTCLVNPDSLDYRHEPPQNYQQWGEVIRAFTQHVVDRYGIDEVREWYFEIWNEPDNSAIFRDDPRYFMALYDYMENAIHSVDSTLKVGGPATKQAEPAFDLFEAFLKHCASEPNYVTGEIGTRVDFISVHCKGGRPPEVFCPSTLVMFDSLRRYLDIIKQFPEYDGIEFVNDESDVVWRGNNGGKDFNWLNFRNTHYFAGFVCKMVNLYCDIVEDEYQANLTIVDSDNCHLQWERYLFSGNRSQFTPLLTYPSTDIIKKSVFNAYVLLSRLGDERLAVHSDVDGFGDKFGVLPTRADDTLSLMIWNFEDGMEGNVNQREIDVQIDNLPFSGKYRLVHYRIDETHSTAYQAWIEQDRPSSPDAAQIKAIREQENLELYEPVHDITLNKATSISVDLPMHAISLILFVPVNGTAPAIPTWIKGIAENGHHGNRQNFLKWTPNEERDFLHYRLWRKADDGDFELIADTPSLNTATYTDMDVQADLRYSYKVQAVNASGKTSDLSEILQANNNSSKGLENHANYS